MNIMSMFTICAVLFVMLLASWYFFAILNLEKEDPELLKMLGSANYFFRKYNDQNN